jgi:hypothetical protein
MRLVQSTHTAMDQLGCAARVLLLPVSRNKCTTTTTTSTATFIVSAYDGAEFLSVVGSSVSLRSFPLIEPHTSEELRPLCAVHEKHQADQQRSTLSQMFFLTMLCCNR